MPTPFNQNPIDPQQYVAYLDLSGGRNTKKDPHALDRNQLAISDNTWMAQGNTIAKRPGNIAAQISTGSFLNNGPAISTFVSLGSVGSGVAAVGMTEGRFFEQTCLVVQSSQNQIYAAALNPSGPSLTTWISIGQVSGGTISSAQLYDPDPTSTNSPDGTLFICNGVDTPKAWYGPGNFLKPITTANLPQKRGAGLPITPKYCATLFSSLFYSGESSDPTAVYVSNPFQPQQFTQSMLVPTGTITSASYIPAYVGRGDGVNGGPVTGLARMGSAMIVYKESSIWAMTQVGVLGDMLWGASVASASVGCLSPRSIVSFDTFHVFLGIDGLYTFDGANTRRISENNPDLFDGPTALIQNRTTAVGVRYGNRYLIFFDATNTGYPNTGAWFDFGKPDADNFPAVGTMSGMNVAGVAPLFGPIDSGNFAWADAMQDSVGVFGGIKNGVVSSDDFGNPIVSSILGKADFFSDVWGDEAPVDEKQVDTVDLLMSFPIVSTNQSYLFNGTLTFDQINQQTSVGVPAPLPFVSGSIVGSAIVGTAVVGSQVGTPSYQGVPMYQQQPAFGTVVQFGFTESSGYPWTCLGYTMLVNRQRRVGSASG